MSKLIAKFITDESGQGVPEYGMILGGVVVIAVLVAVALRDTIVDLFNTVDGKITDGMDTIEAGGAG